MDKGFYYLFNVVTYSPIVWHVIASEAKQSAFYELQTDCFVATLLAMTHETEGEREYNI